MPGQSVWSGVSRDPPLTCFSPAEILYGVHLIVRDKRTLHPGVKILREATVGDITGQLGQLRPPTRHLLHLLHLPQQAGVEVVDVEHGLLGH